MADTRKYTTDDDGRPCTSTLAIVGPYKKVWRDRLLRIWSPQCRLVKRFSLKSEQNVTRIRKKHFYLAVMVSDYEIMKDLLRRTETNADKFRFDFWEPRDNSKNLGKSPIHSSIPLNSNED